MLKKIRSLVSNSDFIEIHDNVLSSCDCDVLIKQFEKEDPSQFRVNSSNDSIKIGLTHFCCWNDTKFEKYNRFLRTALLSPISAYKEKYGEILGDLEQTNPYWNINEWYNFQKFEEGGGYYTLHSEHEPASPYRMAVWMIYLNDAICGTEFRYQNRVVNAKAGRLVIWPAFWTHAHKGVTPNKGVKYMMTGWCSYDSSGQNIDTAPPGLRKREINVTLLEGDTLKQERNFRSSDDLRF